MCFKKIESLWRGTVLYKGLSTAFSMDISYLSTASSTASLLMWLANVSGKDWKMTKGFGPFMGSAGEVQAPDWSGPAPDILAV